MAAARLASTLTRTGDIVPGRHACRRHSEMHDERRQEAERERLDPGRVVMVVPTYNEADNLAWIVGRLRAAVPDVDVLVVDDGSPDGTGSIADALAAARPAGQRAAPHRARPASGRRTSHGFAVALERGYDVVGEMDADGSHQPEQLPALLEAPLETPTW